MSKALTLGNGQILVNFDEAGRPRDFYFPYVGLENHIGGHLKHSIGVFADNRMSWIGEPNWQITVGSRPDTFQGETVAAQPQAELELHITDLIYNEKNILLRRVRLKNTAHRARPLKLFFHHQFELYESRIAHTAFYEPRLQAVVHYRNKRAFAVGATLNGKPFDDYSMGVFGRDGKEGTHRDADDGELQKNAIEHGPADSVIALTDTYGPGEERTIYYWLTVGFSIEEALALHQEVNQKGPAHIIETTSNFWRAWVNRRNFSFFGLSPEIITLFKQSLFIIRAHSDHDGGIIASSDSDIMQYGKDTYNYVWPRDGTMTALALMVAGDAPVARSFFNFCNQVISPGGYFMHKYGPDRSLGSSWHPWMVGGKFRLPIQEDETGIVIWALWHYYLVSKDLEFIESVYNSLIKPAADFLVLYRDEKTGLPKASYDLWEEKYGIHTYTASVVYGALSAASRFAELLGKLKSHLVYAKAAEEVRGGILNHLYDEETGCFYKLMWIDHTGQISIDPTIDSSSVYGIYNFGVLLPTDERVERAVVATRHHLQAPQGGITRYQEDAYYRRDGAASNVWLVTTLWLAQYDIAVAKSEAELQKVRATLEWVKTHASKSGILAEQLEPTTGYQLSAAPLTWSHAEFVLTIIKYLDKLEALGVCQACNPVY